MKKKKFNLWRQILILKATVCCLFIFYHSVSPLGSPLLGRRNGERIAIQGTSPKMLDMMGVMRQPRGPDNSGGFYGGIGRGKPRSNTIA